MSKEYIKIKLKRLNKIKIFVVKKNDYNSLLSEVLKVFRQLGYNVKVEEK
jgi:hypothetical protein